MFVVKNRLISLIGRTIGFILFLVATVFYFLQIGSPSEALIYFNVQSCLFFLLILFIEIISNSIDLRHGIKGIPAGINMKVALPCISYALVSGIIYFAVTIREHEVAYSIPGLLFNLGLIIIPLCDFLFFDEKGSVRWYNAFFSMIYPLFYLVFVMLRAYIWPNDLLYGSQTYPYDFLNPKNPYYLAYVFATFLILYAFNLVMMLINNLLSGKYSYLFRKDE